MAEVDIRKPGAFTMIGGFNISNSDPIDSRMYVTDISHIYLDSNWTNVKPYPGLIVSDPNGEIRICINSDYTKESSWKKIIVGDVGNIDNTISGLISDVSATTESINTLESAVSANTKTIESIQDTLDGMPDNDTKNTAGSSESKEKLYLIGAPEQTESGTTTYSNSNIYVSGETLYVKGDNVLVSSDITGITESVNTLDTSVSANTESINTLKGIVGAPAIDETEATGLVKEVADLKAEVEAIEIPDVTIYETIDNVNKVREDVSANTESINDINKLLEAGITTDDTYVSEEITIAGGPLADLAKQVYTGGTVPQGISIQEFLINLLCQEIYPNTTSSVGKYSISLNNAPSISANVNSGSLQELGTKVTFNAVTAVMVSENKTNPKVTGFEYGYSDTINGTIVPGPTSVTTTLSSSQKSGEVYKLSASKNGFSGSIQANASNATYSSCKLSATTLTVALGTNSYTVTETPPKYTYSYSSIGSKYIVSNLGNMNENKKSEAVEAKTATDSNQPTTSSTFTVTGVYPVYTNISNGAFTDDATTKMNLQTSTTFTFENVPGEVGGNPFMFDFPSGKSVSSFQMKNPSGEWVSFSSDYTTDTTVTKTINGTSYTYKRLKTDGTQGAGNTYKVVLNTALNV